MKFLLFLLFVSCITSCAHKNESVEFKLPDVPYATAGETPAKKKEFTFPAVPYAQ